MGGGAEQEETGFLANPHQNAEVGTHFGKERRISLGVHLPALVILNEVKAPCSSAAQSAEILHFVQDDKTSFRMTNTGLG
jgi:hypothetical protein